jgi:hypothetical protein
LQLNRRPFAKTKLRLIDARPVLLDVTDSLSVEAAAQQIAV